MVFIASLFPCEKCGRELRISFKKSYDPSKEADDVFLKGLRIVILFCGKSLQVANREETNRDRNEPWRAPSLVLEALN